MVNVSGILGLSLGKGASSRGSATILSLWGDGAPGEAMNSPEERI